MKDEPRQQRPRSAGLDDMMGNKRLSDYSASAPNSRPDRASGDGGTLDERTAFEGAAFNQRFLSGLKRNPDRNAQFPAFTVDCPMQADFVAKNEDGTYKEESLNPAWWAWQKRATVGAVGHDASSEQKPNPICPMCGKQHEAFTPCEGEPNAVNAVAVREALAELVRLRAFDATNADEWAEYERASRAAWSAAHALIGEPT